MKRNTLSTFLVMAVFSGSSMLVQAERSPQDAAVAKGEKDYVVRSNADLVVLNVAVVNANGKPVSGLDKEHFVIKEDGRAQTIKQFSSVDAPVSLGLLVDMSGSMTNKILSMRRAINTFLRESNPQDEYFVVGFNDRPRFVLPPEMAFSHKQEDVRDALLASRPEGRTALYDGIAAAVDHIAKGAFERRVLILVSDGKDTASALQLNQALERIRSSSITVYAIALFDDDDEDRNSRVLKQIARISGGVYFHPLSPEAIEQSCLRIAKDIRARYTMAYTPPVATGNKHNSTRKIKVDLLRSPGVESGLSVRARTEYNVGKQDEY